MPIDDVQFLQENSVLDSALVFVDSAKRDRLFYKTPSEYVVTFDEPLRNVFGMDVLDATIPGTMYNVDHHNNTLRTITIDNARSSATQRAAASVNASSFASVLLSTEAQDAAQTYVVSTEMFALGFCNDAVLWLADSSLDRKLLVMSDDVFNSNPPPSSEAMDDGSGCAILIRHIIEGVPMVLSKTSAPGTFEFANKVYAVADGNNALSAWINSPDRDVDFALLPSTVTWDQSTFVGASQATPMYDILYHRTLPITAAQYAVYTSSYAKPMAAGRAPLEIMFSLKFSTATFEPGSYTVATLLLQMQEKLRPIGVDVGSPSSGTVDKQGIYMFSSDKDTRFLFCIGSSTSGDLLGFDLLADTAINALPSSTRSYTAVNFGKQERPFFMSIMKYNATLQSVGISMKAPGIANLLGVRYITLRCNEIEQHMSNIGKYGKQSTGIGVFKLANSSEVAQLRFDFVSLIRRPFHPIGRLTRMTLRFEMTNGSLYDFKGMNHQLLVTLKYYSPAPATLPGGGTAVKLPRSVLNPDYDPDFNNYLLRQDRDAARALVVDRGYEDDLEEEEKGDAEEGSYLRGEEGGDAGGGSRNDAINRNDDNRDDGGLKSFDEDVKRRVLLLQYKNDFMDTYLGPEF
jgi:hypothetical protein